MSIIPTTKIVKDGIVKIVNSDQVPERLTLGWSIVGEPIRVELPSENKARPVDVLIKNIRKKKKTTA